MRIGGVAAITGLVVGIALTEWTGPDHFAPLWLLSAAPVLVAGLTEDLGRGVSPRGRFVAAIFSAVAAVWLLGAWVPRGNFPGLDWAMSAPLVAMAMTVVFSAVFCHAVNLIDGMNGLSSIVVVSAALGLAAIAARASEADIMAVALLLAAAATGFFLVNWPVARMFLGDAGAYGMGHLLVCLMVLLAWRSTEVAVPALLLVLFWPIADVMHTVLRRVAAHVSVLQPDRMHLHQLIRRALDIIWFGYRGRSRSNPLTTLLMVPLILPPIAAGVALWNRPVAAWIMLGSFLAMFAATHPLVAWIARTRR
ncbi:MAG: UDP-phosphate N-acetylglucosaminyl 1-phosphate transferase [Rhodobacteraceae bacterium]|nr:UDP-phosphate N-acetylglucosaminyl 1-phosphate transferase [Paracoccaceae bacterium]